MPRKLDLNTEGDFGVVEDNPEIDAAVGKRVREAAAGVGGLTQLAARSKIPLRTINDYAGGKKLPLSRAVVICRVLGISLEWLATGTGEMLLPPVGEGAKETSHAVPRIAKEVAAAQARYSAGNGAVLDDVVFGLTKRRLNQWAATVAGWGARKFSAQTVGTVVEAVDLVLRITRGTAAPEEKRLAVLVLADHFERAGAVDRDSVLANVVRLMA